MHSNMSGMIFDALNHFGEDFRCTHPFWGRFFDALKHFWGWFSMHSNIFGNDFRCTQTFLGKIFDALKHLWGWFSMHSNISGNDFRCTQTFLGMIFDALKHFWGWFSMHWNIFGNDFRCTEGVPATVFNAMVANQCIEKCGSSRTSALKIVVLQGSVPGVSHGRVPQVHWLCLQCPEKFSMQWSRSTALKKAFV